MLRIIGSLLFLQSSLLLAGVVYEVDSTHSVALYKIKHKNVGENYGRFNDVSGSIDFDTAAPTKSKVNLTIQAASIDTASKKRDDHLRGPDFFNAKQFPTITFRSEKIEQDASNKDNFWVSGKLSMHGKSKDAKLLVRKTGEGIEPNGKKSIGFATEHNLKRSEFDVSYMLGPIADDLTVIVSLEAIEK